MPEIELFVALRHSRLNLQFSRIKFGERAIHIFQNVHIFRRGRVTELVSSDVIRIAEIANSVHKPVIMVVYIPLFFVRQNTTRAVLEIKQILLSEKRLRFVIFCGILSVDNSQ